MKTTKLTVKGKYPEIELKDIHFCCVEECPRDEITMFLGIDISVPKSKLGETVSEIFKFRDMIDNTSNESEWELTLEKLKVKQAKLP